MSRLSSIHHHLDCEEYLLSDELESTYDLFEDGNLSIFQMDDTSIEYYSSENLDSLVVDGYNSDPGSTQTHRHHESDEFEKQRILQEKINEVKSCTQGREAGRGRSFVDALELFNANREVFLQIIQNPDSVVSENYFRDLRNSSTSFIKRGSPSSEDFKSFPSLRKLKIGKKKKKKKKKKEEEEEDEVVGEEEQKEAGKMVVGDRISMDGVLHRIPYGRSLSLSSTQKDGVIGSSYASRRRFTKSRSLSESLEQYSSLLESAASATKLSPSLEHSRSFTRHLSSTKRPTKSLSSKSLTRILSMTEFDVGSRIASNFHQRISDIDDNNLTSKKPKTEEPSISAVIEEEEEEEKPEPLDVKITKMNEKAETLSRINNTSTEFDYMISILKKSGFGGGGGTPDSEHYLQLDHSLFEESERMTTDCDDVNLNHLLLFDLINQVLMEIWENSFAIQPWLKRFGHRRQLRPTFPALESRVLLDDICGSIGWYLSYESSRSDRAIEYVVSRDVERSDDGWMNVGYEIDDVGVDFEEMILDDVLDDVIEDLLDSNHHCEYDYGLYY
ncbi:hypothetical protein ZOSMA_446G00070 [Zostera marina]|uniref:DUF4378 domain-containing protein n=1 Tax=Zostera marina TaxID=29655 RepID=A0A0K9P3H2_ZOSMR|nr:hypothetical protein ZOSMA_446G00070 [Zostera marina]